MVTVDMGAVVDPTPLVTDLYSSSHHATNNGGVSPLLALVPSPYAEVLKASGNLLWLLADTTVSAVHGYFPYLLHPNSFGRSSN
ncbi:hypothetical protein DSO57_1021157 [Entomophthora muscae]|uniref:Uncharacterized protein n=1 Tax=Entomophthora muscae TaxID=34485 RepID=A0ACC2TQX9_9FUNG|nr:hypothetical protein DSO57_1021157 [Entomophthora muscae]